MLDGIHIIERIHARGALINAVEDLDKEEDRERADAQLRIADRGSEARAASSSESELGVCHGGLTTAPPG
jgi:hypothetical protein